MYEYKRTRGGLGALGSDPFSWRNRSCSGGGGVMLGEAEVACVPPDARGRATSRGCVPTQVDGTGSCSGGGSFYCCPDRGKLRELQQEIVSSGCSLPQYGVDGLWGTETAHGVQCMIDRDGWQAVSGRFQVIQGLVQPPAEDDSPAVIGDLVGSTRLIRRESYGGLGMWGYIGLGAAALVLGFAIAQVIKKDEPEEEELDEEEFEFGYGRPSMAGSY